MYRIADILLRYEIQVATCRYYEQERHLVATPALFADWIEGLSGVKRAIRIASGIEVAKQNSSFRRYVLERHGFSLYDHMTAQLSPDALHYWQHEPPIWGAALDPD